jgi:TorA maturation chaperone TorD
MGSASLLTQDGTEFEKPSVPPAAVGDGAGSLSNEELERAALYRVLATLLSDVPDQTFLDQIGGIEIAADDKTPYGQALTELAAAARDANAEAVGREYHALFIGIGEGELVPYGSYYQTGFLHERPLARLRGDMGALGIERPDGVAEPEDGIASLCEIMAGLITGAFGETIPVDRQRDFFEAHLAPWAGRFFTDLEAAETANFYKSVGKLGQVFFDIESEAFPIMD